MIGQLTERFMALFAGLSRAHGIYTINKEQTTTVKKKGIAKTVKELVTWRLWDEHLEGRQGLGIVPIRDDGTCRFAAIDIDTYDLDLEELSRILVRLKLPFLVCRTKSGGVHLYMFFCEDVEARLIRVKLEELSAGLGFPGVEIFPKQDLLDTEKDVGNWINMPYFDCERSVRYCVHDGRALSVSQFLELAETKKITAAELEVLSIVDDDELIGAPPCLQHLARIGFPRGSMNNALLSLGVYAKKRYGEEDFDRHVWRYNEKYMAPGSPQEVRAVLKSLGRKDYFYKCKDAPLKDHCNKKLCGKCLYGIAESTDDPGYIIDGITKICSDPPQYIVAIAGADKPARLIAEELMSQAKFGKRVFELTDFYPDAVAPTKWRAMINDVMKSAVHELAPDDASPEGQFWQLVKEFTTERGEARHRDELALGRPWINESEGRIYFRSQDLQKFLQQQRFFSIKGNEIWSVMRKNQAVEHGFWNIKGKGVNWWSIPLIDRQNEPHDVPDGLQDLADF